MKLSTLSRAKHFEHMVADQLRRHGALVVPETLIGHKKVDVYFEQMQIGTRIRTAVECKCYDSALTSGQVSGIYADYLPLYKNLVDQILIVTRSGVSPAAAALIREVRELSHVTLSELGEQTMDFGSYLRDIVSQVESDPMFECYISPLTVDGKDLGSQVEDWVVKGGKPLAVVGGYGMGKTTFAAHMARRWAKAAVSDQMARVPLLIQLKDIASDQSLEGLLGKVFTAHHQVGNYSFSGLMDLSSRGRFITILDGFDEMRHTMSWDEFRHNMRELNRLVTVNSRVILLGRPNVFLSDDERRYALSGWRNIGDQSVKMQDWPEYQQVQMVGFSREQVRDYLGKFVAARMRSGEPMTALRREERRIRRHMDDITSKRFADIARRPVQLYMLVQILPDYDGDLDSLTVAALYDTFIDMIIERDQDKLIRQEFTSKDRRRFASKLAFWLWSEKRSDSVRVDEIPAMIWDEVCGDRGVSDAVKRDFVSASFLEAKSDGTLYFPHRSFQEFLVAGEVMHALACQELDFRESAGVLTQEVAQFVRGQAGVADLARWESALREYRGLIPSRLAGLWVSEDSYVDYVLTRIAADGVPWYGLFAVLAAVQGNLEDHITARELSTRLLESIGSAGPERALLAFTCIVVLVGRAGGDVITDAISALARAGERQIREKQKSLEDHGWVDIWVHHTVRDPIIAGFIRRLQFSERRRQVDLSATYRYLCNVLTPYAMIDDWVAGETLKLRDVDLPRLVWVSDEEFTVVKTMVAEWGRADGQPH